MVGTRISPTTTRGPEQEGSNAEGAVVLQAPGGRQDGLREQQHQERAHEHCVGMKRQRERRPLARLDCSNLSERVRDEPDQRVGDEARGHEDVDPAIHGLCERAVG